MPTTINPTNNKKPTEEKHSRWAGKG